MIALKQSTMESLFIIDSYCLETLMILSKYTTPRVFLSLLPEDGNFAFFLPYLVKCCENDSGQRLSNEVHGR